MKKLIKLLFPILLVSICQLNCFSMTFLVNSQKYTNLATQEYEKGNYYQAIEYYKKIAENVEMSTAVNYETKNSLMMATYMFIAETYEFKLQNYKMALDYYNIASRFNIYHDNPNSILYFENAFKRCQSKIIQSN